MGAGNKVHADMFEVAVIYQTSVCPLAMVMRHELRKRGIDSLKVVYSKEKPIRPLKDLSISCRQHCICPPGTVRKCTERRDIPGSTPLYAPLEKQRKINGLQFHTGLRKATRSIDRTAFALYTLIILDMSKKSTIPAVDNRICY